MSSELSEFHDAFFEESAEHLGNIEAGLLRVEQENCDGEVLNAIFRAVHSIKGLAATLGFAPVAAFTHEFESVLDCLRLGQLASSPDVTQLLFRANDTLRDLLNAAKAGEEATVDTAQVTSALQAALGAQTAAGPTGQGEPVPSTAVSPVPRWYSIRFIPKASLFAQGQDPMLVVRELAELGDEASVVCDTSRLTAFDSLDPEQCQLLWVVKVRTAATKEAIAQILLFVEDECEYSIRDVTDDPSRAGVAANVPPIGTAAQHAERLPLETSSIRVPTDKIDALVDLVGEMVISQAMINQIAADFDESQLQLLREALASLDRGTRELQERVMAVRMLPVATVFNRFPRLVRDVATTLGKKVKLEMVGAETELDKGMIERIGDPLTHLVRNAIDHGLEGPGERRATGKDETGTVTLRALHEGGNVVVEIEDDGRGLNTQRIREKAIERGLIRAEDTLTDQELHQLIFVAGFSTAAAVSDLSGRGVGLDVVKRNVEALSGSVSLSSCAGQGSRVRIRLPLTLAILDGLIVSVGVESYVMPLLSVIESLRPSPTDVRQILGAGEVLVVRGESLPFVRLHVVFGHGDAIVEPSLGIVVIVESDGKRFGLLVDEVVGQQQVVIKNLDSNFRKVEATMGATILGDGRVALIVDVQELLRLANKKRPPDELFALRPAAFAVGEIVP